MNINFLRIDVEETNNPDIPFKFQVFLDGELINKLSTSVKKTRESDGTITEKNQLQEAFDWIHCLKTNIAVQNGVFPASKLKDHGIPNLFEKSEE